MLNFKQTSRGEERARLQDNYEKATKMNVTYKSFYNSSEKMEYLQSRSLSFILNGLHQNKACSMLLCLAISLMICGAGREVSAATVPVPPATEADSTSKANAQESTGSLSRASLEAELNEILQRTDGQDGKLLSEAIISRLMLGNLSDSGESMLEGSNSGAESANLLLGEDSAASGTSDIANIDDNEDQQASSDNARLRKILSYVHNYGISPANGGLNGGQVFNQYPILPASQASTIKRASAKMGNYLKQQQQANRPAAYNRNNFNFGLGKRPDSSVSSNVLRFGDSSMGANSHLVSGSLGKRPSAHRFDFGLGKRLASPARPRYDFGLGKRAQNRIRYDFGLGRR